MGILDHEKLAMAQDRYAIAAGVDPHVADRPACESYKTDPRDELLQSIWTMLDATYRMTFRLGDGPVERIEVSEQADLVGDVLTLGSVVIDLSTAKVERANDARTPCCFLIDGVPLRITYSAWHVDATMEVMEHLASMVDDAKAGRNAGASVTIDGTTETVTPNRMRAYETKFGDRTSRFGKLFTYRMEGPVLDLCSNGSVEGIDYEGRFVRIAPIPAEADTRMAA